jgi:hypothetical protein
MRLWLLRRVDRTKQPWDPYPETCYFGFVIRASSETAARAIAAMNAGDEEMAWLSATPTTCQELTPDGPQGIIVTEFSGA